MRNVHEIETEITEWIAGYPDTITTDFRHNTDLLETGVIDSIGFLDLIEFLEEKNGLSIDFEILEHDSDVTTVRGLAKFVSGLVQ